MYSSSSNTTVVYYHIDNRFDKQFEINVTKEMLLQSLYIEMYQRSYYWDAFIYMLLLKWYETVIENIRWESVSDPLPLSFF